MGTLTAFYFVFIIIDVLTNIIIILSHAFFVFFIHSIFVPNKDCVNVLCMSAVLTRKQYAAHNNLK